MTLGNNVMLVLDGGLSTKVSTQTVLISMARTHIQFALQRIEPEARVRVFRFRSGLLARQLESGEYGSIFLFGFGGGDSASRDDRRAFLRFLSLGGGCFATGDHAALGNSLCGMLYGVRNLRCWDNHHPRRPNAETLNRSINTLHNPDLAEVDCHPKPVFAKSQTHHLVMRGPSRPIQYLPDHAHEGRLDIDKLPRRLAARGGCNDVLYAVGRNAQDNTLGLVPVVRCFEPGPNEAMGRIVIDSTTHHWLDDNLTELPAHALADAKAYMANVLNYILPQAQRRSRVLTILRRLACRNQQIAERIPELAAATTPQEVKRRSAVIGQMAIRVLDKTEPEYAIVFSDLHLLYRAKDGGQGLAATRSSQLRQTRGARQPAESRGVADIATDPASFDVRLAHALFAVSSLRSAGV